MRHFVLATVLVFLVSCTSKLTVQVDIFDPKGLSADDAIEATVQREAANHAYLLKTDLYARTKVSLKTELRNYLQFLTDIGIVARSDIDKFGKAADNRINAAILSSMRKRNAGLEQTRRAGTTIKPPERREVFDSALDQFASATHELTELLTQVQKPYEGALKKKLVELQAVREPNLELINRITHTQSGFEAAFEKNLQSLTGGFGLFDDPLASAVVSAPEEYWQGIYNKTEASGQMGNTDIAIKMETVGTFTIKGLRLDASKVTEATFDVVKQSVRMVAAAYGVPLPGAIQQPSEGVSTSPTDIVLATDQLIQTAERKRQLSRNAALTLLDIIVSERADLVASDDAKRRAAIHRIKQSFEAYKSQLMGE